MTAGSPGFHQGPRAPWQTDYHSPALADEVVTLLGGAELVLDGTLGGGGHAAALLESGVERVIGIDRDPEALAEARARLAAASARGRFAAYQGNYAAIDAIPAIADLRFNGILLDLGISSHQIDDASRGFSFREGAPLDMRMGGAGDAAPSAEELLGSASDEELVRIFRAVRRRAARGAARARDRAPARDTPVRARATISSAPSAARSARERVRRDFARLFQAVRIAVNDELAGSGARASRAARPPRAGRHARRHRVSLRGGPAREARVPRMERGLHLPAAPSHVRVRGRSRTRRDGHAARDRRVARRGRAQPARSQRQAPRMARKVAGSGRLRFALLLLGFVLIASGVVLRRTYGIRAAREIQAMETRRSGLDRRASPAGVRDPHRVEPRAAPADRRAAAADARADGVAGGVPDAGSARRR